MGVGVHGVAIVRALSGDEPVVVSATDARADIEVLLLLCVISFFALFGA